MIKTIVEFNLAAKAMLVKYTEDVWVSTSVTCWNETSVQWGIYNSKSGSVTSNDSAEHCIDLAEKVLTGVKSQDNFDISEKPCVDEAIPLGDIETPIFEQIDGGGEIEETQQTPDDDLPW